MAEWSAKLLHKLESTVWTSERRPVFLRYPSKKILGWAKAVSFHILPISLYTDSSYHWTLRNLHILRITDTATESKFVLSKHFVLPLFHHLAILSLCPAPVKIGQNWLSQQGASAWSPWQPASDPVAPHHTTMPTVNHRNHKAITEYCLASLCSG